MTSVLVILAAAAVAGGLAFSRRLATSSEWKATVTPLASIMGSGFLVSAPLLASVVGNLAAVAMVGLLVLAYLVGDAIRFNIRHFEPIEDAERGLPQGVAFLSRLVLAGAYFISVTYYLQLLAAFVLNIFGSGSSVAANAITTALLVGIGLVGIVRGLGVLEGLERFAVSLNLGMIAALLAALVTYNAGLAARGTWVMADVSSTVDVADLRVLLGLLIVVQGFETSRYLGAEHSAEQRIRTMRRAQLLSAAIYIVFISTTTVLFRADVGADVTAIVEMTRGVVPVLPLLLSVAAIGSQFSAAVGDQAGAGGLIEEITHRKVSPKYVYLLILVVTVVVTWETHVNEIIAYASRAFALYYALQCLVASLVAWENRSLPGRGWTMAKYGALAVFCLAVFAFGVPAE